LHAAPSRSYWALLAAAIFNRNSACIGLVIMDTADGGVCIEGVGAKAGAFTLRDVTALLVVPVPG